MSVEVREEKNTLCLINQGEMREGQREESPAGGDDAGDPKDYCSNEELFRELYGNLPDDNNV